MFHVVFHLTPSILLTGNISSPSAQIALLHVNGAMRHVRAKGVRSMVSQTLVLTACVKPGRSGSSVDRTNVRANSRLLMHLRTLVSSRLLEPYSSSYFLVGFPPNGEGAWPAASDQANGVPSGAAPAIPPQYLPPEGYWPYPYYPPPPGYVAPPPDGHANGDSSPHGQPAHHPAYYPIHPGYPPVPIYPPPPGAYGPIPVPPGQAPPIEQTAGNQTATSDDERPSVERPKKKKRSGGEDGTSKSSKKSKRVLNSVNEAVVAVSAIPIAAPPSDDSPDDHGSPIAHSRPASGGDEPLPPVIAAA